jgi:hypothetical protein
VKEQSYLLYSETGKQIDNYFFPHDAVAAYHFSSGTSHPFFYNDGKLLYNKPFKKRLYLLEKATITPLYDIGLPDYLPMKKIEEKMEPMELIRSDYSYGLNEIFISGQIMHFIFFKSGFIHSCFYNVETGKVLFCGPRVLANPRETLPFYALIRGVYKGKFYALVSPMEMEHLKERKLEILSDNLKNIQIEDNYIVAFYKITQ